MSVEAEVYGIESDERETLLSWLEKGLRDGRRGRLRAEYPVSLEEGAAECHRVVLEAGHPVAHAMWHVALMQADAVRVPIGMIGLVYTDPASRGRGLARACIEACLRDLAARGVPVAALWSDRHALYARLGFHPAGREKLYGVDGPICRRAQPEARRPIVAPARTRDFPQLEALYAAKRIRVRRSPGALAALASAPDTAIVVAREGDEPLAYAALGRGDDFPGVVHEWAGDPRGVLACLEALCSEGGAVGWLGGPLDAEPGPALLRAGASVHPGAFGLVRLLDAGELWRSFAPSLSERVRFESVEGAVALAGGRGAVRLDMAEALSLLFDGRISARARRALTPSERDALREHLPLPLYVWGFDSI